MQVLSFEQMYAINDRPVTELPIPEWGVNVGV